MHFRAGTGATNTLYKFIRAKQIQLNTSHSLLSTMKTTEPTEPKKAEIMQDFERLKWKPQERFSLGFYRDLSKSKLAGFVLLTTLAGYAMAPGALDGSTLTFTLLGTGLCVASANTINQWVETPYDAQMNRTRNRVLVRHALSPLHAFSVGIASGIGGTWMLYHFINPYAAILGFSNIILYTCVYTPLKRTSIYNTWAGAIVGAIPPAIGWVAYTGAWLLGAALFAWQFPHFNALSWNLRPDYSKAGYRMMSVLNPALNARVSLRYALAMFPISFGFYYVDLVSWYFLLDSSLINGYKAYYAFKFWKNSNDSPARKLFFSSLIHLPVFLLLLLIHKQKQSGKQDEVMKKAVDISL